MVVKKQKKLMAVQADLVEKIIRISNIKGRTVYSFVNEIMEQAIEAEDLGQSLKEIVEIYRLMEIEKKTGAVLTTREILNFLVQKLYPSEEEALMEKWYISGEWYGKYVLTRFQDGEPLEMLDKLLQVYLWEASEIRILRGKDSIGLRCVAPNHTTEETSLLSSFLEGAMHSMGYTLRKRDLLKGLILLDFEKRT